MASGDVLARFREGDQEILSATFATPDIRNGHSVLDFDAALDEAAQFQGVLEGYGASGLTVECWIAMTSATSGNIVLEASVERVGAETQDIDSDSFAAANKSATTAVPGTSGHLKKVSVTFTDGADMDSLANGEPFRLKIVRPGSSDSNDTAAGDLELWEVVIKET